MFSIQMMRVHVHSLKRKSLQSIMWMKPDTMMCANS